MLDTPEAPVGRKIRCLLFDLGDTLWYRNSQESWERLENRSNQRAVEILRQAIDSALLPRLDDQSLGQRLRQFFDEQIRTMIRRSPLQEPDACQAIATVLSAWGLDSTNTSLNTLLFEALRIRIPHSRSLFPDALSALDELRRRGFLLGVVTNRLWGGPLFYEDLQTIGLLEYFDPKHIAISGDLRVRKPNTRIFDYVLQALCVSPEETAMVGDSLSADIVGAQQMGIFSIWKPKTWMREWALEHARTLPPAPNSSDQWLSQGTFPGIDTADTQIEERSEASQILPEGIYVTDDDYIMARAAKGRDYLEQFQRGDIRPDRIISELVELLQIFPEAVES